QFHAKDARARLAFVGEPTQRTADTVHAGGLLQRVTAGERLVYPAERRDREARPDGVTGTQQRAEVRAVQRPEGCRDEMPPASVPARTPSRPDLPRGPDPDRGLHRTGAEALQHLKIMYDVLLGAREPSTNDGIPFDSVQRGAQPQPPKIGLP